MSGFPSVFLHFLWLVPLILLIAYIGSPRFRGTMGEDRVRRALSTALQKNQFTVFHGLTIPSNGGTRRIDHLVVSQFGIFVIGTEYRPGRVSGTAVQDRWKHYRLGRFTRFDNPLHQNELGIEALGHLLNLSRTRFHSFVVFSSHSHFRDQSPEYVIPVEKLIPLIRKCSQKLLQPEEANQVLKQIESARVGISGGFILDRWMLLRWLLVAILLGAGWFAFRAELVTVGAYLQERREMRSTPEQFHPDGTRKTEMQLWEDSLVCAYSSDIGRCACYEPGGARVELPVEECQSLAERGSILKR